MILTIKVALGEQNIPDEWSSHLTENEQEARDFRQSKRETEMLAGLRGRIA